MKAHDKQIREIKQARAAEHEADRLRQKRRQEHEALLNQKIEQSEEAIAAPQAELDAVRQSDRNLKRKIEEEPLKLRDVLVPAQVQISD